MIVSIVGKFEDNGNFLIFPGFTRTYFYKAIPVLLLEWIEERIK
jgi:hypothetical protein